MNSGHPSSQADTSGAPTSVEPSEEEGPEDFVSRLGVMDSTGQKTVFEIIPSKPDGNCMFRALSQAMHGHERLHRKCRQDVVDYISDEAHWPHFSTHIKGQNDHLVQKRQDDKSDKEKGKGDKSTGLPNTRSSEVEEETAGESFKESYRKYMLGDGAYGTLQELIAASDLFQFNLIVIRQLSSTFINILSFKDSFTYDITHHFLFTGITPDDGHFEYLEPTSQTLEIESKSVKLEKGYYKIDFIEDHCVVMQQHFGPLPSFDDPDDVRDPSRDATQGSRTELDINANKTSHDSSPTGRRPARIELKRGSSRVNTNSEDSGYRVGGRPSLLSQCLRNKVHPSSSDGSCHQLLRPQRKSSGGRVKEGPIPTWIRRFQSFCCCAGSAPSPP